ncbi:MAG: hypothetical protein ACRDT1_12225 [Micromonosporaceae bacterium]
MLVASLTALLAGCGAGQQSQTARTTVAIPGVDADAGKVALRNLQVVYPGREHRTYPVGGLAPLDVQIFNTGQEPDALVAVKAAGFGKVVLIGSDRQPSELCREAPVRTRPARPADTPPSEPAEVSPSPGQESPATPETSPSASTEHSPGHGPEPAPTPDEAAGSAKFTISLPPDGCALLGPNGTHQLAISELSEEISPGDEVPITFVFRNAGELTVEAPVGMPTEPADNSPMNMHPEEPPMVGEGHGSDSGGEGHE